MELSNLVKTVSGFAPLLGTVLGGPGGAAIGELIAHEFGGSTDNPDNLVNLIVKDPAAQVKLVEIQSNCKVQLQQIAAQNLQNELAAQTAAIQSDRLDRADARQNNKANIYVPEIISLTIIVGFFLCLYLVKTLPQDNPYHDLLNIMIGTLASGFTGVWNYWLGSSDGSRNKDIAIHDTLANLSTPTTN